MVFDKGPVSSLSRGAPVRDVLPCHPNAYLNINHTIYIEGEPFKIPKAYRIKKVIGQGSYGLVCSGLNSITTEKVAIKKNKDIFPRTPSLVSKGGKAPHRSLLSQKRILRELKILQHLKHPNIVSLKECVIPDSFDSFGDVYFITDLMEADMRDILNSNQLLTDQHVQYFMYQLLLALYYIHSADVLHRDMKPENILLNCDCELKLCDFGLARGMDFDQNPTMSTNYVQTRWYRAPELLLNNSTVSKAIDMWSVGCIMAELLSRRVMFQGISPIEQMKLIVQTLGTPDISNIKGCKEGVDFVRQLPHSKGKRFEDMFPLANPQALDVLKQMLQFNPDKRTDALTALRHPYFRQYYDERDIVAADSKFDFSFEDHLHDWNSIKREAYSTILAFNHINPRNATNDYSYFDEFRFNPVSEAMKEFQEAQDEEREEERRKHITKNSPLQTRKIIHPQPNYYAPAERPRTEDEKPPTGLRNNRRFSLVRKIKQALKI